LAQAFWPLRSIPEGQGGEFRSASVTLSVIESLKRERQIGTPRGKGGAEGTTGVLRSSKVVGSR